MGPNEPETPTQPHLCTAEVHIKADPALSFDPTSSVTLSPSFPVGRDDGGQWRLDIVALLAVTGEAFIHEHSQAITSSALCMLPRIMPAPQALMQPWRPVSLPSETAKVTGVYSGLVMDSLGFFANIIHPLDLLPPFAFRVIEIKRNDHRLYDSPIPLEKIPGSAAARTERATTNPGPNHRNGNAMNSGDDAETGTNGVFRRRATIQERVSDFITNAPDVKDPSERPSAKYRARFKSQASLYSPLNLLAIFSFFLTVGLVVAAIVLHDGTALLGIILISMASSIIGAAAWWKPALLPRRNSNRTPPGDVIIRNREGVLVLIKCTEEIARELYSGVEECLYYTSGRAYRIYMILGAIIIMPAVILFGNCTFTMQLLVGIAYMLLNVLYWALGLLPRSLYWDLSRYKWNDITPPDAAGCETGDDDSGIASYTRTLWYAIRETKSTEWARRTGAVPGTREWNKWLSEAEAAAVREERNWRAVARKNDIMKEERNYWD
ncbi:hypothetical protein FBEOM_8904 [Fusarium beomiforme]|uniref:Uncharacterized protein n=1 Tax=Fusarium beomiforme TaxID=44412 RepID=A0A9P5DU15_9HYPO|nr:hypothetical protein FBEOM_8904 [Fusarium beomiforme]